MMLMGFADDLISSATGYVKGFAQEKAQGAITQVETGVVDALKPYLIVGGILVGTIAVFSLSSFMRNRRLEKKVQPLSGSRRRR